MSASKGQPGTWWIINTAPDGGSGVLYWTGGLYHDGRCIVSYNHLDAAQFVSKAQAEFNWEMIAKPTCKTAVRAEQHDWS